MASVSIENDSVEYDGFNTAIINVGISPIPIGFPKLGLSENKFISLGYPCVIIDKENTILVINSVIFVFIVVIFIEPQFTINYNY